MIGTSVEGCRPRRPQTDTISELWKRRTQLKAKRNMRIIDQISATHKILPILILGTEDIRPPSIQCIDWMPDFKKRGNPPFLKGLKSFMQLRIDGATTAYVGCYMEFNHKKRRSLIKGWN